MVIGVREGVEEDGNKKNQSDFAFSLIRERVKNSPLDLDIFPVSSFKCSPCTQ